MKRLTLIFLLLSFWAYSQPTAGGKLTVNGTAQKIIVNGTTNKLVVQQGNPFGGDTNFDADFLLFRARVWKDGGTIINARYADSCIKFYKTFGIWNAIISDYDANYAVKFTVSGNDSLVDKLYDLKSRYDMIGTTTTRPDLQKNVKNGKYSIMFDSTSTKYLIYTFSSSTIQYSQPLTLVSVFKSHQSDYPTTNKLVFISKSGNFSFIGKVAGIYQRYTNYAGVFYNYTLSANTWQVNTAMFGTLTNNSKLLLNGGSISTGLNFGNTQNIGTQMYLGFTSNSWGNYITKLLIIQGDYATQATWIHSFLNQRYNIY